MKSHKTLLTLLIKVTFHPDRLLLFGHFTTFSQSRVDITTIGVVGGVGVSVSVVVVGYFLAGSRISSRTRRDLSISIKKRHGYKHGRFQDRIAKTVTFNDLLRLVAFYDCVQALKTSATHHILAASLLDPEALDSISDMEEQGIIPRRPE